MGAENGVTAADLVFAVVLWVMKLGIWLRADGARASAGTGTTFFLKLMAAAQARNQQTLDGVLRRQAGLGQLPVDRLPAAPGEQLAGPAEGPGAEEPAIGRHRARVS